MDEFADIEQAVADVVAARHPPGDEWFWCELSLVRTRWNPARHPFFVRFSQGGLTRSELQVYVEEHERLVLAMAALTRNAKCKSAGLLQHTLSARAAQTEAEIDLWHRLAQAAGWGQRSSWYYDADPFAATIKCAGIWAKPNRSLAGDLIMLHALDAREPEFALLQLDALTRCYGLDNGPGTEYFRRRVCAAGEPGAVSQAALQGLLSSADHFALLDQAALVYQSYWSMLDMLSQGDKR